MRHAVHARDAQPRLLGAGVREARPDGGHDQVLLPQRHLAGPLAGHVDHQTVAVRGVDRLDGDQVVQGERETEAVETRPQVRAGRRHADRDRDADADAVHAPAGVVRRRGPGQRGDEASTHDKLTTQARAPAPR